MGLRKYEAKVMVIRKREERKGRMLSIGRAESLSLACEEGST